jgi:hypothetical protein
MNGLTTMKGLLNRALAAGALAALIFLPAMHAPTRAQGGAGKVSMNDISFAASVGVASGETLRLSVVNALMLDGSTRIVGGHVKVFDGLTGAELGTHELINPPAGLHMIDIGGSGRDILIGGSGVDRVQLWVEVKLVTRYDTKTEEPGAGILAPTFELMDDATHRTTVRGTLVKVGTGSVVLPTS